MFNSTGARNDLSVYSLGTAGIQAAKRPSVEVIFEIQLET
jgi:hypothetical protein